MVTLISVACILLWSQLHFPVLRFKWSMALLVTFGHMWLFLKFIMENIKIQCLGCLCLKHCRNWWLLCWITQLQIVLFPSLPKVVLDNPVVKGIRNLVLKKKISAGPGVNMLFLLDQEEVRIDILWWWFSEYTGFPSQTW